MLDPGGFGSVTTSPPNLGLSSISIIYEFTDSPNEAMVPQVCGMLREKGLRVRKVQGVFRRYQPGGLRVRRLINLVWIVLSVPFELILRRPEKLLVRSTPPGIQIWAALWMRILRIRGILWLLDYHPEIEARMLERKGVVGRSVAATFRRLDRWSQNSFEKVIVPDEAMAEEVGKNTRHPGVRVFPTWSSGAGDRKQETAPVAARGDDTIRVLYCGNLGAGHELEPFARWAEEEGKRQGTIRIVTVGTGESGQARFAEIAKRLPNSAWEHWGSLSDEELPVRVSEEAVTFGLVVMREELKGLLSPSKFGTYLRLGLPVLYFGPQGTNADRVCREFGGGLAFGAGEGRDLCKEGGNQESEMANVQHRTSNIEHREVESEERTGGTLEKNHSLHPETFREGVDRAREYFGSFTAEGFVAEVLGGR